MAGNSPDAIGVLHELTPLKPPRSETRPKGRAQKKPSYPEKSLVFFKIFACTVASSSVFVAHICYKSSKCRKTETCALAFINLRGQPATVVIRNTFHHQQQTQIYLFELQACQVRYSALRPWCVARTFAATGPPRGPPRGPPGGPRGPIGKFLLLRK